MKVTKGAENGVLLIDGHKIDGFVDDKLCPHCSESRIYFNDYDAFFCASCNKWLEPQCSDKTCNYCKHRPIKPLD
jgi:hypothetical protein